MGIERVTHYIDNVLTEAQARMGLSNTRLLVAWYTNWENKQSVVHSHPYHGDYCRVQGGQDCARLS